MPNIFRRSASGRVSSNDLIKKNPIANEFWEASTSPPTYYGILKRWNGSIWMKEPLKTWLTGSWQSKPLKKWNGNEWKLIDTTGI